MKNDICKVIVYVGVLSIICVLSFLFAKYMVRSGINKNDIPIDTSVRLR